MPARRRRRKRDRRASALPYVTGALAAALHHRGCLRHARGEHAAGIDDVLRATTIDPHPRELTTLALFHEREGDVVSARRAHDQAIAALASIPRPIDTWGGAVVELPERVCRYSARSHLARGAFLGRLGERGLAREDLERAQAAEPSSGAARWITWLQGRS